MAELRWFEVTPPRDVDLAAVTSVLRPLANRPRPGLTGTTPLTVFEAWAHGGEIHWRLGVDAQIAREVSAQLRAHLPKMGLTRLPRAKRPALLLGADVRLRGLSSPLRLDTAGAVSAELLDALGSLYAGEAGVVQWLIGPSQPRGSVPARFNLAESLGMRMPQEPDATTTRLWRQKAAEPMFAAHGRIGAMAVNAGRAYNIIRSLGSALKLTSAEHASLQLSKSSAGRARKVTEVARPLSWGCLLSAAELAAVLGWPVQEVVGDDLPVIGGHINPTPEGLLVSEDDERSGARVLGESLHPAQRGELVTMPVATALHHVQVIGPTGSGKSTFLAALALADIAARRGVLLIEPKGDLVDDVLARVPADRRDDVVVIDPANAERVVGVNVLAGEPAQAERRADQIVGLLAEMHGANWGPRTADVALHAILTVSRLKDGALPDVPVLLTNPAFRRSVLARVSDPLVLAPWWAWYDNLSTAERGHVIAPLLNKLRAFLSRDALRRMLGQPKPRFSLDELFLKPGRIVLINLNKGLLGGPTASLLGALLLTQVWAAIQRRTAIPAGKRHPVMVVIDEYQDYLHLPGIDLDDALAQARGLGVGLTLAHQHLDQLSKAQQAAILANARSRVVFRPATGDAKPLAASFGSDVTGDDLLRLRAFEACAQLLIDSRPSAPFSVRTRALPPWTSKPGDIRRRSAQRWGDDGAAIDAALTERWQGGDAPEAPVGIKRRSAS
jgi:hypothetical protein